MHHFVASLITDPAKIIELPFTFIKMLVEFGKQVLQLMV